MQGAVEVDLFQVIKTFCHAGLRQYRNKASTAQEEKMTWKVSNHVWIKIPNFQKMKIIYSVLRRNLIVIKHDQLHHPKATAVCARVWTKMKYKFKVFYNHLRTSLIVSKILWLKVWCIRQGLHREYMIRRHNFIGTIPWRSTLFLLRNNGHHRWKQWNQQLLTNK